MKHTCMEVVAITIEFINTLSITTHAQVPDLDRVLNNRCQKVPRHIPANWVYRLSVSAQNQNNCIESLIPKAQIEIFKEQIQCQPHLLQLLKERKPTRSFLQASKCIMLDHNMRQNIQMQRKQQMPKASGKIPPAHLKFAINELTVDIFISCQIRSARDCPTSPRMSTWVLPRTLQSLKVEHQTMQTSVFCYDKLGHQARVTNSMRLE